MQDQNKRILIFTGQNISDENPTGDSGTEHLGIYADKLKSQITDLEIIRENTNSLIERHNITRFPCIMFLKEDAVVKTMYGKFMNNEVDKYLQELRWV